MPALCIMSVPCRCLISSALPCLCLNLFIFSPLFTNWVITPLYSTVMLITPPTLPKISHGHDFSNVFGPPACTTHVLILKPYAGGVRGAKRAPRYLPSLSGLSERFQKNYSDICMNRGSKAPAAKPTANASQTNRPAAHPLLPRSSLYTPFINTNYTPWSPTTRIC